MNPAYDDTVIVVTGASTGLGRAIAVATAQQGAKAVIVNYASNDAEAQETARLVTGAGAEAVLQKGFDATPIEEIVASAEITKSGFFYHSPTRTPSPMR